MNGLTMSNELRQRQPNYDPFIYSKSHVPPPDFGDELDDGLVKDKFKDFADKTTAHGAKRILIAHNGISRMFWMSLIVFFLTLFLYQATTLVMKYKKHDKITSISLKFDQVEFPAITFCNLNPYKKSLVVMVPSIRDTMDVYDNAKTHSKTDKPKKPKFRRKQHQVESAKRVQELFAKEIAQGQEELRKQQLARGQIRRLTKRDVSAIAPSTETSFKPRFEAIDAHCKCVGNLDMECIRFETPPKDENSKCVCTYDRDMMVAWPCFNISVWFDHTCPSCKEDGYCEYSLREDEAGKENLLEWPCKCRNRTEGTDLDDPLEKWHGFTKAPYCIGKEPVEIRKLWVDDTNRTTTTTTNITTTIPSTIPTTSEPATTTPATTSTTTTTTATPPPRRLQ
ncbi:hypothetical protein Y032_0015g2757 [Ancylostoma ceylanicum]|uniref:Degenerin n=2 Tax=Ancylostoma ceylanicum TaxID=53326 RepID=A0A016V7L8_9BILA|nr:hypothetical protein Y032_0015g2757 [Ancylostoma ceylanicum]